MQQQYTQYTSDAAMPDAAMPGAAMPGPKPDRLHGRRLAATVILLAFLSGFLLLPGCAGEIAVDLHGYQRSDQATEYVAIVTNKDAEAIIIQLLPEYAPETVANFQKLVGEKFYDGLIFHRVVASFLIQGGDPAGDGTGGPGYTIKGEFTKNGFKSFLKHTRGVISMARQSSDMNSAGSQFFICLSDQPDWNGSYASFGKVVEGMDTVDRIGSVATNSSSRPTTKQIMKEVFFVTPPAA